MPISNETDREMVDFLVNVYVINGTYLPIVIYQLIYLNPLPNFLKQHEHFATNEKDNL